MFLKIFFFCIVLYFNFHFWIYNCITADTLQMHSKIVDQRMFSGIVLNSRELVMMDYIDMMDCINVRPKADEKPA